MAAMVVCPLCEHPQATGEDCEVCGKRLTGPGVVPLPVEALPGFEPTVAAATGAAYADPMPGLEPTLMAPVDAVALPATEVEPTRMAPVNPPVEVVPGFEPTEAEPIPGDAPAALPAVRVCRYCRTPAPPSDVICGGCGMKLPAFGPGPADVAASGEPAPVRCFSCATLNSGPERFCSGCGALVRRG
jgi:predicted amidophosphoribosyltransferase